HAADAHDVSERARHPPQRLELVGGIAVAEDADEDVAREDGHLPPMVALEVAMLAEGADAGEDERAGLVTVPHREQAPGLVAIHEVRRVRPLESAALEGLHGRSSFRRPEATGEVQKHGVSGVGPQTNDSDAVTATSDSAIRSGPDESSVVSPTRTATARRDR